MQRHDKMKGILIALLFLPILFSLVSAEVHSLPYGTKLNQCIDLPQNCANCSYVNITSITAPNSSVILGQHVMTKQDTLYNYTFCGNTALGFYIVNWKADPDGLTDSGSYSYEVTPLGNIQSTSQGIGGLAPIFIVLALTFIFGALTFAFASTKNFKPVALLFFGLFIIFVLISLHLGYVYTRDVAVLENTSNTMLGVYKTIMWTFTITFFISLVFMVVFVIKQWKAGKRSLNEEDGWDNGMFR